MAAKAPAKGPTVAQQNRTIAAGANQFVQSEAAQGTMVVPNPGASAAQDTAQTNAFDAYNSNAGIAGTPANTAANTASTTATQQTDLLNGQNATNSIAATLNSLGLGGMTDWATTLAYQLSGQGISTSDIVNTITGQMNNPTNADGSINQGALDAFNAALPGFNQRITATGNNGSPGSSPAQAIANYISYGTQLQQFAQQAGLLPGTITADTIGNLWANDVSSSEVSQRITLATVNASSAPPEVQDYLSKSFGMTPQALTSFYLNPTNTLQQIQTNMNTGMVGGEASITGFDKNLSTAQASALGAFLANGASSGSAGQIGGVNAVSAGTASNAFNSGLGSNLAGGALGSAAAMANAGYTSGNLPGQTGGQVSEDTLLSAIEGNAPALAQTAAAEQTRTAGSKGGGGATTTASGAVGLGFASS